MDTMKVRTVWPALAGLIVLAAGPGTAQDKKADYEAAMAKYGTPGPEHKALDALVGNWTCKAKFWAGPEQVMESEGTVQRKWIFDNRFVEEHFTGNAFGKPFKGLGLTGYDRFQKQYQTLWIDSMSTGMMKSHGTYDAGSKTFTFKGEEHDPVMGKMKTRDVLRIVDDSKHVLEAYRQGQQGPEFKVMEIVCTRQAK
jgi:hypothetical protein